MPAAIPEPDRRPPLTAHITSAQNNTAAINRNTAAQITLHRSEQHRRKITATLAATIPETSPAASLDYLTALLDNVRKVG